MIFAAIDYFLYRYRRGKYSHKEMINNGWYLATKQKFSNCQSSEVGDLIFTSTSDSILSWAVMYFTKSVVSHCAMFYDKGIIHDCTTSGVLRCSFESYLDEKSYLKIIRPPNMSEDKQREAKVFMDETLGHGYAWHKVIWLFISIIFGANNSFSWRFYFDIAIVLLALWLACSHFSTTLGIPFMVAFVSYSAVVIFNQFRKRNKQTRAIGYKFEHYIFYINQ